MPQTTAQRKRNTHRTKPAIQRTSRVYGPVLTANEVYPYLAQIRELTKYNNHVRSLLVLARDVLRDKDLTTRLEDLDKRHMKAGHLTPPLKFNHWRLYKAAMRQAKARMAPSVYVQVHKSF